MLWRPRIIDPLDDIRFELQVLGGVLAYFIRKFGVEHSAQTGVERGKRGRELQFVREKKLYGGDTLLPVYYFTDYPILAQTHLP